MPELNTLLTGIRQGDRLALARALTRVANGERLPESEVPGGLRRSARQVRVIAFTGSAGVGKSTLIGKLINHLRGKDLRVAVLACDPQSPLTGGALLGDRFRMPSRPDDDGVFIRSLAAVSGRGAIAEHLPTMVRFLQAFGERGVSTPCSANQGVDTPRSPFDVILIETVGAGQGDTAVHDLADVVVLLVQPETGDDLQWEKAGVLEIADVIVVHKADLPGAEQTAAQLRESCQLSAAGAIPVLLVSSKTGAGALELCRILTTDN